MKQIWNIGGSLQNYRVLLNFFTMTSKSESIKNKYDFKVFDCPSGICWQGGRLSKPPQTFDWKVVELLRAYKQWFDVGINFVFSNSLLEPMHLNDKRGNYFLEKFSEEGNGVIVASELLANYIRKFYPNYKITYSMTHGKVKDVKYHKKLLNTYDIVVLHPDLAYDDSFLDNFTADEKAKIEILVNENCFKGCQLRTEHYRQMSSYNLCNNANSYITSRKLCYINRMNVGPLNFESSNVSLERINILREKGFCNFKLAGRSADTGDNINPLFLHDFSNYILKDLGIDPLVTFMYLLNNQEPEKHVEDIKRYTEEIS